MMRYMWIIYSLFGAIFQAAEMAIKKKALQVRGLNNVIALIAYGFAGLLLLALYIFQSGQFWIAAPLSAVFWNGIFWTVLLNMVGVWFMYRALDLADLSYLMPFMTLTSLSLIIPPMIFLGEFPMLRSFFGIVLVVIGALAMDYKFEKSKLSAEDHHRRKNNRKGLVYFIATALCYTFTPTAMKIATVASNVLFATYLVHLLMGVGFLLLIAIIAVSQARKNGERKNVARVLNEEFARTKNQLTDAGVKFFLAVLIAGVAIAIQNGSINYAFTLAPVASVMAIKRTMPLFAFVIGYLYFKERANVGQKLAATALMIIGAVLITAF
jgi:drug/metabolite transporter (DMT)-like permease